MKEQVFLHPTMGILVIKNLKHSYLIDDGFSPVRWCNLTVTRFIISNSEFIGEL